MIFQEFIYLLIYYLIKWGLIHFLIYHSIQFGTHMTRDASDEVLFSAMSQTCRDMPEVFGSFAPQATIYIGSLSLTAE